MRALLVAFAFTVLGCSAPSDTPPPGSHGPIVGHVRLRGRTIDLTVDAVEARGGDPELRDATARHEARAADREVWADVDDRELRRAD